jgi:hypothetical protein
MDAIRNLRKIKIKIPVSTFGNKGNKILSMSNNYISSNCYFLKLQRKNYFALDTHNDNNNIEFNEDDLNHFLDRFQNGEIELPEFPNNLKKFIGLIKRIPSVPKEPDSDECCGDGCKPCVYDSYEEKIEKRKILIEQLFRDIKKP